MRLIDADALIEAIRHDVDQTPDSDWGYGLNHAIPIVRSQRTVNAVMVVRCKDCNKRETMYCPFYWRYKGTKYDDWFCADGKRTEP